MRDYKHLLLDLALAGVEIELVKELNATFDFLDDKLKDGADILINAGDVIRRLKVTEDRYNFLSKHPRVEVYIDGDEYSGKELDLMVDQVRVEEM